MLKTSVMFAVATIAVCGAIAVAADKSVGHDQTASQAKPAAGD